MAPTPHSDPPPATGADSSKAQRTAAKRRVVGITRVTAVGAALTTGVVAVLAATSQHATTTAAVSSSVSSLPSVDVTATDDDSSQTLSAAPEVPTISNDAPVASSGGS